MTPRRSSVERPEAYDAPTRAKFTKLFRVIQGLIAAMGYNCAHNNDRPRFAEDQPNLVHTISSNISRS